MDMPRGDWFIKCWAPDKPRVLRALRVHFPLHDEPHILSYGVFAEEDGVLENYVYPASGTQPGGLARILSWGPGRDVPSGYFEFALEWYDATGATTAQQYFAGNVVNGVFVGRYTEASPNEQLRWSPSTYARYTGHATGWHKDTINRNAPGPRVFELRFQLPPDTSGVSPVSMASLRFDVLPPMPTVLPPGVSTNPRPPTFYGRMKVYARLTDAPPRDGHIHSAREGVGGYEEIEYDLQPVVDPAGGGMLVAYTDEDGSPGSIRFGRRSATWSETFLGQQLKTVFHPIALARAGIDNLHIPSGRTLVGTLTHDTISGLKWWAHRSEVLSYGMSPRIEGPAVWQSTVRPAVQHLMMGGNPNLPANPTQVSTVVYQGPWAQSWPRVEGNTPGVRDDPHSNDLMPPTYLVSEFLLDHSIPDPYSADPNRSTSMQRRTHGYVTIPADPAPPGGFPVVLALNGHAGCAYAMLRPGQRRDATGPRGDFMPLQAQPRLPDAIPEPRLQPYRHCPPDYDVREYGASAQYFYGDAFARSGFVVLAIDIGHRNDFPLDQVTDPSSPDFASAPVDLTGTLPQSPNCNNPFPNDSYYQYLNASNAGDDRLNGNILRPSIKSARFGSDSTTDWTEDGMRVWDALRALDTLLAGKFNPAPPDTTNPSTPRAIAVNPRAIVVAGLSMGGEVAAMVGALDPRIAVTVSAGYTPETGNHVIWGHQCMLWVYADNREYFNTSDFHALTAPRMLVLQTGTNDHVYSAAGDWCFDLLQQATDPAVTFKRFTNSKTVTRRSRVAYVDQPGQLLHQLFHYPPSADWLDHIMRFGAKLPSTAATRCNETYTPATQYLKILDAVNKGPESYVRVSNGYLVQRDTRPVDYANLWQNDAQVQVLPSWDDLVTGIRAALRRVA